MPSTSDRILRAPASRVEPKVFVKPQYADPGAVGEVVHDLRTLVREAKKAGDVLSRENAKGQRLAHSLSPFLKQHTELVEQHARVLKLIDERAGEAGALYKMLSERADKIDLFDATFNQRMDEMRDLLGVVESRLSEAHGAVGRIEGQLDNHCNATCDRINAQIEEAQQRVTRIEEQSSEAMNRLRREFDAHLIQAADDANARIESSGDRLESLEHAARLAAGKLQNALDEVIVSAKAEVGGIKNELESEVKGARSCVNEAIEETRAATDQLYADLEQQKTDANTAALELEETLERSRDSAKTLLSETQTRIDNTMRLGRLKLDELCNAFTMWIEAGETSVRKTMKETSEHFDEMRVLIENETAQGVAIVGTARDESIKRIEKTSTGASSKFEDAERALGEVIGSVRNELSTFDTEMFARIETARQRIDGIVEQEAQRAEQIRSTIGQELDQRLADLTGQCDRAQSILLGEHGPDTTGLLAMLEKAESLEKAVESADERAAFATRQLEAIREQANMVRSALGRAVLLAAEATDQADARAAMLGTALEQAKATTDRIASVVHDETQGAD